MSIFNPWEDWEYETAVGRVEVEGAEDRDALELSDVEREEAQYVPHWSTEAVNQDRENAAIDLEIERMLEEINGLK